LGSVSVLLLLLLLVPSPFGNLKMKTAHGLVMFKSFPLFTSSYSYSYFFLFHLHVPVPFNITLFSCQIQLKNAFSKKKYFLGDGNEK